MCAVIASFGGSDEEQSQMPSDELESHSEGLTSLRAPAGLGSREYQHERNSLEVSGMCPWLLAYE